MHTTGLTWTDLNDGFVVAIHIEAKSGEADAVAALSPANPGNRSWD